MAYKIHECIRRTPISVRQIKKQLDIKIFSKRYNLGYIYKVWFWLNKPWLELNVN